MSTNLDEAQIETVTVEYFRALGYEYAHGPSIAPDGDAPERANYGQVVLLRRLQATFLFASHPEWTLHDQTHPREGRK